MIYEPWSWILVTVAAYVAVCLALTYSVEYFYGYRAEEKYIQKTIALPMWFAWGVLLVIKDMVTAVVTHPFRARFRNQFYDVFQAFPTSWSDGYYYGQSAMKVHEGLTKRAIAFHAAINNQEAARSRDPEALMKADQQVTVTKKAFWDAHGMARKAGYNVRSSYKDYLPPESVTSEIRSTRTQRR